MRTTGILVALAMVTAACSGGGGNNPDGGNPNPDGGNPNPDGGNPNPDGGGGAWTVMNLPSTHDTDTITGIFYSSPTAGFVVTVGGTGSNAGAVFATTATTVGAIAFDGDVSQSAGGVLGGLDFQGILPTPAGVLVAVTDNNDLVSAPSLTSGAFTDVKNGTTDIGGGQPAGVYFGANLTVFADDGAGVINAPSAPSPNAVYTETYNAGSNPTVPNPIPNGDCLDPIEVADSFQSGLSSATFSADGNTIAYTTLSDADAVPEICVSTDGGQNFLPTELTGKPQLKPGGIIFPKPSDTSTLIVYSGDMVNAGANYVLRSTDGGKTFNPTTLPTGLTAKEMNLYGAFFLADGLHGWIVGYDGTADTGLALVTTDGGQTWNADATVAAVTGAGVQRLHTVFALDTSHVWMGGESGTLISSSH